MMSWSKRDFRLSQVFLLGLLSLCCLVGSKQPEVKRINDVRILVLFSTTKNELGLDHRLGGQIIKLAKSKAIQMHPELANGLVIQIDHDDGECKSGNSLPSKLVDRYYSSDDPTKECYGISNCSGHDIDHDLVLYLDKITSSRKQTKKRWINLAGHNDTSSQAIDVILGPYCDYLVDLVARMGSYWRLPVYSVASISAQFSRKDIYPTLTRLSPSIDQLSSFIMKTMQKFNWYHMSILIDQDQIEHVLMLDNLDRTINRLAYSIPIKRQILQVRSKELWNKSNSTEEMTSSSSAGILMKKRSLCSETAKRVLMDSKRVSRVILLLLDGSLALRQLLLCAYELGFQEAGFTFLTLDLGLKSVDTSAASATGATRSKSGSSQSFDWYLANDEDNNPIAKRMFESLLIFSVELPIGDEYNLFVEQTLDMANQQYPEAKFDRSAVNSLAIALHDSLLLAVEAHLRSTNKRINRDKGIYRNKTGIDDSDWIKASSNSENVPLLWNEHLSSTNQGLITSSMHINSNGDQELDYILSDLEPELGVMRPVASYSKETRQIELVADSYIHWPKRLNTLTGELLDMDQAPPDEPECGFMDDADHCIDRQNLYAALSIMACLVALIATGSLFSYYKYRNIKYQMQLDDYWWKINWEDLHFVQMTESLTSNAQSIARAIKSGASVVSAGSDGGSSYVSIQRPAKKIEDRRSAEISASNRPVVDDLDEQAATNKQDEPHNDRSNNRRAAVPLIITNNGKSSLEHQTSIAEEGSVQRGAQSGVTGRNSGSLLAAGSVLIRSEFSSVVKASNLAMYKDELVIVKQLNADRIEVTKNLLIELKSIRELVNDNLAKFVGLCLDQQRLAIVYEFCSRGSLQDLLLNENAAMDLTLKYSIIGDIINGLGFIHTTLLDYHGRLKSTNLVLDGRFTVKITDFGLQNLYSQLDPIEDCDHDQEDEDEDEDEDKENEEKHHDQISLSVSQSAYNMESVSIRGARTYGGGSQRGSDRRMRLRNRGSARFFWTAPEHLREKNTHFAGSKRGDIYSLAIILYELYTRREPYYYGTNAQPNWSSINRDRKLFMMKQHQQQNQNSSRDFLTTGGPRRSRLGSTISTGRRDSRLTTTQEGSSEVSVGAGKKLQRGMQTQKPGRNHYMKKNSVCPSEEQQSDAISIISGTSQVSSISEATNEPDRSSKVLLDHQRTMKTRIGSIDEEDPARADKTIAARAGKKQSKESLDAAQIIDQLRMGIQPEPVRPYIPNYVVHEIDPRLIGLMRNCWNESAGARPQLASIKTQLRKISKGLASRNYLDNLLERLQNYASELERIVDGKSADIMGEKQRTEELLYQLVPKFVAERLKNSEPIVPQVFDGVTIFFSDIVGFEKYASVMSPSELVDLLNSIYSSFDSIISSFDVTKIETIIDQFLVAAGISFQQAALQQDSFNSTNATTGSVAQPSNKEQSQQSADTKISSNSIKTKIKSKRIGLLSHLRGSHGSGDTQQATDSIDQPPDSGGPTNNATTGSERAFDVNHYRRSSAEQIARMALCIRDLVKSFHFRQTINQQQQSGLVASSFNIRIGIHSGKVCAGIVGLKRPKFCLIGDTVNVASRMHTNSKANRIQISADTRHLLEQVPGFNIEPRGKIEVKGKGLMETFWLESSY